MTDLVPLTIAHSPDPDDAFMWWPVTTRDGHPPSIDTGRFVFRTVAEDIETLNREAEEGGRYEITALSCAQYGVVSDRYALTACGASMGDGYGPKLVAQVPMTVDELRQATPTIAVPGRRTTAFAAASMLLAPASFSAIELPFDEIIEAVASGEVPVGLVIHEGQLTFQDAGLHLIADLGAWWRERTGLPLPLGVNAIRRDLETRFGPGTLAEVTDVLRRSVEHALSHREESIRVALEYARGIDAETAGRFVDLYVNQWTLEFGPTGRRAVTTFLDAMREHGLGPGAAGVEFIAPATP